MVDDSGDMIQEPEVPEQKKIRLGDHINRGFQSYFDQWQNWISPVLMAGVIYIAGHLCCILPGLLAVGPLFTGLHFCAINCVRKRTVKVGGLRRGWERAGRSILASFVITLLQILPMLLIYGLFFGFFAAAVPFMPNQPGQRPGPQLFSLVFFLAIYAFMFVAMFGMLAWNLWINTKTMFVYPLIADRDLTFSEAWGLSWDETRTKFWELLVLNFLATFLGSIGMYVCYIGVIFSIPLYFTMIASAYDERFPQTAKPLEAVDFET